MRFIKLFEEYEVETSVSTEFDEVLSEHGEDFVFKAMLAMKEWFFGDFMGVEEEGEEVRNAINLMRTVGKYYHKKSVTKDIYRISHLRVSSDDLLSVKHCKTGPKRLQSWSTTKEGAMFFFKHFVRDQNKHAEKVPDKAWVLVKTSWRNVEQLIRFEECIQFLQDIKKADMNSQITGYVEALLDNLVGNNGDEMYKLHELICYTPDDVPVNVEKIIVPAGQPKYTTSRSVISSWADLFN